MLLGSRLAPIARGGGGCVTSWNIGTKNLIFKILLWWTGRHRTLIFRVRISLWTSAKFVYMMLVESKLAPPRRSQVGHKLEHRNKEKQLQNSSSLKLKALELWCLVFSISLWTFINLMHMIPLESKLTPQRGHKLEHRNKEDQLQNSSSLKLEGISLDFWYVASPCRPLSILFIWCPLGSKLAPPWGSQVGTKGSKM